MTHIVRSPVKPVLGIKAADTLPMVAVASALAEGLHCPLEQATGACMVVYALAEKTSNFSCMQRAGLRELINLKTQLYPPLCQLFHSLLPS